MNEEQREAIKHAGDDKEDAEVQAVKTIVYYYRGYIERASTNRKRLSYRFCYGYSQNTQSDNVVFPWQTRRECQEDARQQGATAVFKMTMVTT